MGLCNLLVQESFGTAQLLSLICMIEYNLTLPALQMTCSLYCDRWLFRKWFTVVNGFISIYINSKCRSTHPNSHKFSLCMNIHTLHLKINATCKSKFLRIWIILHIIIVCYGESIYKVHKYTKDKIHVIAKITFGTIVQPSIPIQSW